MSPTNYQQIVSITFYCQDPPNKIAMLFPELLSKPIVVAEASELTGVSLDTCAGGQGGQFPSPASGDHLRIYLETRVKRERENNNNQQNCNNSTQALRSLKMK